MPRISVLMPAYNSEEYIGEAIESILNQTFSDFEFIIINDGSTDDTAKVVKEYVKKDKRIRFINNKKNQGLIAVLNQGLDLCAGEYIARMDSDDISLPERFAKQIKYMDEHPECGVLGGAGQNFGADTHIYYSPEKVCAFDLLCGVGFYHPSVMLRKSVMDKYNFRYDSLYYLVEDLDLWERMLHVTQLHNLPEILIKYRVHDASVSNSNRELQESNKQIVRNRLLDSISTNMDIRKYLLRKSGHEPDVTEEKHWWWLFNLIPCVKTYAKPSENYAKFWLFGFIPLAKIKHNHFYLFHIFKIAKIKRIQMQDITETKFYEYHTDDTNILNALRSLPENFTYIPNSGNIGDMLIAYSTLKFFDRNKLKYKMYTGKNAGAIVYGGGGQWTADYVQHWLKWLDVFKDAKQIVILPSSFYKCPQLISVLDERFTVFCREKRSYDYLMSANTKAKIVLDHDMALRLKPDSLSRPIKLKTREEKEAIKKVLEAIPDTKNIVNFNRTDCESSGHYKTDLDLSVVCYGNSMSAPEYIEFCAKLMLCAVDCADAIITDRLHVGIAAAFMGKEVYLLDNSYKKLSSVYEHSLFRNPKIHFCNKIPKENEINPDLTEKKFFKALQNLV